jgi:hypothetical protein
MQELKVDPKRYRKFGETGIFIRATLEGKWKSVDIADLDKESLLAWLKSRDGNNKYAEDVVGILLGHGHLHPIPQDENPKEA